MRLIDADELKRSFNKLCDRFGEDFHISAIETEIDAAQTVDAAEVVRCRDCKKHCEYNGKHYCKFWRMYCPDGSDFFCKAGERKEGAD